MNMSMKIIVKRPNEMPFPLIIKNELEPMQAIVQGSIELVRLGRDICMICNEEGKLIGLKPNFYIAGELIVGNVFFARAFQEDFVSLAKVDVLQLSAYFKIWIKENNDDVSLVFRKIAEDF